jgi:hypothetical protein
MSWRHELWWNLTTPKALLGLRMPVFPAAAFRSAVDLIDADLEAGRIGEAEREARIGRIARDKAVWIWRWQLRRLQRTGRG